METDNLIPEERVENNVYARNIKGDIIHVLQAPSGQQGYYCLGCDREMQSVRQSIAHRMSFFRHVHNADLPERKCVYSDETYRHQLAKRILLQNLYVKVPPVYKYPPKGTNGLAILLKDSEIVKAHSALPEVTIYEDEDGNVKWGSNMTVDEKYLVVRPDIVFFDNQGEPVLLIELVATHGVNNEKKVKLRRLAINSIQIKIPKDSPESIENAFNITQNTKWIYNYDESSTQYFSVSETSSEGISSIDENQRRLFEETFSCRQSQIGNLIRTIGKCVESQHYRGIEEGFRNEIQRTTSNTELHQSRLDDIRTERKESITDGFKHQVEELVREETEFEGDEGDFQRNRVDLEARYRAKDSDLERQTEDAEREIYGETEIEGRLGETVEERRKQVIRDTSQIRRDIEKEEDEIRRIEQEESGLSEHFRREAENLTERFNRLQTEERSDFERIERELENIQFKFQSLEDELRVGINEEEENLPREFGEEDSRIEKDSEGIRERANQIVMSRITEGSTDLHRRVRGLLEARKLLDDITEVRIDNNRNRKAWECFKSGAYENWVDGE